MGWLDLEEMSENVNEGCLSWSIQGIDTVLRGQNILTSVKIYWCNSAGVSDAAAHPTVIPVTFGKRFLSEAEV